jgi:hypothetical protein
MDILQRLGGRKFILALIAVAVGTAIELNTARGLSATMAGLLGTLVAAFSAANYAVTKKHMESRSGGKNLDEIASMIENRNNTETEVVTQLIGVLTNNERQLGEVKAAVAQVGQAMVNVSRAVAQKGS